MDGEAEVTQSADDSVVAVATEENAPSNEDNIENHASKMQQIREVSQCLGMAKGKLDFWSKSYEPKNQDDIETLKSMIEALSAYLKNTKKPQQFKRSEMDSSIEQYRSKFLYSMQNFSSLSGSDLENIESIQKECDDVFGEVIYLPEAYGG